MRSLCLVALLLLQACGGSEGRLVDPDDIQGGSLPMALEGRVGDPQAGQIVFSDRDQGHCVLCHQVEGLAAEFQGNIGPDLTLVSDRLDEGQIRLRIVDYELIRPETLMPSYYRLHDLNQVEDRYKAQTILTAQQIEDLVAYLATLKHDTD